MIESFDGRTVYDSIFVRKMGMKYYAVLQRIGAELWEEALQYHIGTKSLKSYVGEW